MGSFVSNIHILSSGNTESARCESIANGFSSFVETNYLPTKDIESSDREVTFLSSNKTPWVTILDSAFEENEIGEQFHFARQISKTLSSVVLSVFIHDSDVLIIGLFRNGRKLDTILHDNDGLEDIGGIPKAVGKPTNFRSSLWESLSCSKFPKHHLRSIETESVFVEDYLEKVCDPLQMHPSNAMSCVSHKEDFASENHVHSIFYKSKHPPLYQQVVESGAPKFAWKSYTDQREMLLGEHLQTSFTVINQGAESQGMVILIWGDAVEKNLIKISEIHVVKNEDYREKRGTDNFARLQVGLTTEKMEGQDYLVAKLPDFQIPPGIGELPKTTEATKAWRRYMDDEMSRHVFVNPIGKTISSGEGTLNLSILPSENPEHGQITQSTKLKISKEKFQQVHGGQRR